ncbi:hypothetical protein M2454_001321 [Aequitasia blattaphilus]|uniref:Dabb family protein n=1 Tax=Aequitasia blattaphilus TaxID=2949332 RepID=A0ABT1E7J7_9FIRM|nr:Dabb family protein [Aequitasia blattaphilus]MCP1101789.1 Dabb family protein [Aequitasia blattaphilus]MCR8614429.1 Dabb family protein [Aequitasia blattaphilus]
MVKHVVMWSFKPEVKEEDKAMRKEEMKKNLEGLVGVVPGLIDAHYVETPLPSSTHDMGLVTTHESPEAIKAYAKNPDHVKVAETYVRPFVHNRSCLDYEA